MRSVQKHIVADDDSLGAARSVAQRVVADHWPELADVEPTVTPRQRSRPSKAVLHRVGVQAGDIIFTPEGGADEYTFTFATETRTPDGHVFPRVARVTVDAQQRVVKTSISK